MPSLVKVSSCFRKAGGSAAVGRNILANKRANVLESVGAGKGEINASSLPQAVDRDTTPLKQIIANDEEQKMKENTEPESTNETSAGRTQPLGQQKTITVDHASTQSKDTTAWTQQPTHTENSIGSTVELISYEPSPDTVTSMNSNNNYESINPYIASREAKIARNLQRLKDLGLLNLPPPPKSKGQPIPKKPKTCNEPVRRSSRISSHTRPIHYGVGATTQNAGKRTRNTPEVASSDPLPVLQKKRIKTLTKQNHPSDQSEGRQRSTTTRPLQSKERASKPLYSIHRFLISDEGTIGIDTGAFHEDRRCIVMRNVPPNSVAFHYGVELNDEIIVPKSASEQDSNPNVYDLFHKAANHRPLLFEVKRAHKSIAVPKALALVGPHSLHRFIINEVGTLGITLKGFGETATIVVAVKPNSLADIYGLRENDVISKPLESVCALAKSGERPWILQLWRSVSTNEIANRRPVWSGGFVENPFIFSFPGKLSMDTTTEKEVAGGIQEGDGEDNTGQEDIPSADERGKVCGE